MEYNLNRFIEAQEQDFRIALKEIKAGEKQSHWMWYIFPQIHGLGTSSTSIYYEIKSITEAINYLNNDYLRNNMVIICNELIKLDIKDPIRIFGSIDALKLHSSMTLFEYISNNYLEEKINLFTLIIEKYFNNQRDINTLYILKKEDDINV